MKSYASPPIDEVTSLCRIIRTNATIDPIRLCYLLFMSARLISKKNHNQLSTITIK